MEYFESIKVEEIPSQISEIFQSLKFSIGDKLANLIFAASSCVGGIVLAFYKGPTYAAVCFAYAPVFFIFLGVFGSLVKRSTSDRIETIKAMGGIAAETISAIKVVASFGGEEKEIQKFCRWAQKACMVGRKFQFFLSVMVGLMKFAVFFFYSYAFFIGAHFIEVHKYNEKSGLNYTSEDIITVQISLITGFITLISALAGIQSIMQAKVLGKYIFDIIEREPKIKDIQDPI